MWHCAVDPGSLRLYLLQTCILRRQEYFFSHFISGPPYVIRFKKPFPARNSRFMEVDHYSQPENSNRISPPFQCPIGHRHMFPLNLDILNLAPVSRKRTGPAKLDRLDSAGLEQLTTNPVSSRILETLRSDGASSRPDFRCKGVRLALRETGTLTTVVVDQNCNFFSRVRPGAICRCYFWRLEWMAWCLGMSWGCGGLFVWRIVGVYEELFTANERGIMTYWLLCFSVGLCYLDWA
jgi:hypothetical protein